MNALYYGAHLDILREHIPDESIDLVYLDPPFNSKVTYNLLFKAPNGHSSEAQIEAFDDSWHWGEQAEQEFDGLLHQANTRVAEMMRAFRQFLGENDMMAYLTMMANRLLQLHRVLKSTGSLYLHCDPTASHYLKILLDAVFEPGNFCNEIVWKRTGAHNSAKRYGPVHDVILFFSNGDRFTWNQQYQDQDKYISERYTYVDERGRRFYPVSLIAAGIRHGSSGKSWRGIDVASKGNHWRYTIEGLDALDAEGDIYWPPKGGLPRLKMYAENAKGSKIQDWWDNIPPINSQAQERLGYPTQKPLALLERIIQASSNEGDMVLDPFCGCGTAVHAAQKLGRQWIGIDITHLAISLIEKRLKDAFPGIQYEVHGTPADLGGASDLARRDKYQFQWWACSLVDAQPFQSKKKGADSGIDGLIFFKDDDQAAKKIVVSVKGGEHVNVAMIRDLKGVLDREKAAIGLFVTLVEPTKQMEVEAASGGFYKSPLFPDRQDPRIQILTVAELLAGARKPSYPNIAGSLLTFKQAKVELKVAEQKQLFDLK